MKLYFLAAVLLVNLSVAGGRTWTNLEGRKIEAEFIEFIGDDRIKLLTHSPSKEYTYPISKLSEADRVYLSKLKKQKVMPASEDKVPELLRQRKFWGFQTGPPLLATFQSLNNGLLKLETEDGETVEFSVDKLAIPERQMLSKYFSSEELEADIDSPIWHTSFAEAKAEAQKEDKLLFIYFTNSRYCPPCRELKKNVLTSGRFKRFAEKHFVLFINDWYQIKNENNEVLEKQSQQLVEDYPHQGYPYIFIADSSGDMIGKTAGYSGESPSTYIKERLKHLVD